MTPYQILGVSEGALPVQVAAAYRKVIAFPLSPAERELADLAYRTIINQTMTLRIESNGGAAAEKFVDFGITLVRGWLIGYAVGGVIMLIGMVVFLVSLR